MKDSSPTRKALFDKWLAVFHSQQAFDSIRRAGPFGLQAGALHLAALKEYEGALRAFLEASDGEG